MAEEAKPARPWISEGMIILVALPSAIFSMAPALEKAMSLGRPVVIDCVIDQDDKVFPMVPAGDSIENVFDQEDLAKKEN